MAQPGPRPGRGRVAVAAKAWPPAGLHGLWAVADYRPPYGWIRRPYARLTCPHGCFLECSGEAAEVARFVAAAHFVHARRCPGPREDNPHG
ncbi:hypothetical protein [Streptomyces sp. DI166]|uniref:hypothetical protein n=1 Tax=Streptomyces sp. DI166 TaxID=1839783 RepID=UPI0011479BCB|nr:hypothetical protein [Streptomyces sp. DI166]